MSKKLPERFVVSAVIFGLVSFSSYSLAGNEYADGLRLKLDSVYKAYQAEKKTIEPEIPEDLTLTQALSVCNAALKNATPDKWELSELKITPYALDNTLLGPSARSAGEDEVSLEIEAHIDVPDTVGTDDTDDILIFFIYP